MRDFRDAKAMAQTLREAFSSKSAVLTHSESLELVARVLGFHDWNVLAARLEEERYRAAGRAAPLSPTPAGAVLPMLPLRDLVPFPRRLWPLLFVGRDKSIRAVGRAIAGDTRILAVTQRREDDDDPGPGAFYKVGVIARVIQQWKMPDGSLKIFASGLERAAVTRFIEGELWTAEVAPIEEQRGQTPEAATLSRAVLDAYQAYSNVNLSSPPQALRGLVDISEPAGTLADDLAQLLSIGIDRRQELLETGDVIARLEKIRELMKTDQQAA